MQAYLAGLRAGTHKTKSRGEVAGLGQEALEAEGHRARPHRLDSQPAVAQGRHRARPGAARATRRRCPRARRRTPCVRRCRTKLREEQRAWCSRVSSSTATRPQALAASLAEPRRRRQGAAGRPPRQREAGAGVAQQSGAQDGRRAGGQRLRRRRPAATWWSARGGARAAGGGARRDENPGHHPHAADHREVDRAARGRNIVAFEVDARANKIEIKKAVEAQFKVKVAEVRVVRAATARCAGRVASPGAGRTGRRPTYGWPPARRRSSSSRVGRERHALSENSRKRTMGIKQIRPINSSSRFQSLLRPSTRSRQRKPQKPLTERQDDERWPQQPRPAHQLVPRRRPQAPLSRDRLQARQARRAGEGGDHRVRPQPLGAHRPAALRGRREALHPGAARA